MIDRPSAIGDPNQKRYRLPGIEREGIAQLSLLETALWPLQGGKIDGSSYESSYSYRAPGGKGTATVIVRSALGLEPIDEYVLWGLLGATLKHVDAEPLLLATPYWMLKHLGLGTGGSQYAELRDALLRLTTTSYYNSAFYNPETQEHEVAAFQFLSVLLPTVGGRGEVVDNERLWRIEWNPAFFRFCRATGGSLLFDLDLYQQLSPASRRLFLKLKDRFWRMKRVFFNINDLTVYGLGFSAERPLFKRKYDLKHCIRELLDHGVIELGRGQTDPAELFMRRSKGCYVVCFYEGAYFRQAVSKRVLRQKNGLQNDPLFQPLQAIGVDEPAIRRTMARHTRANIQKWIRITDAAMHEKPAGFPGFKVSPAAFFIDAINNVRMPPDWIYAHEKQQRKEQEERERRSLVADEQALRKKFDEDRSTALRRFLLTGEGQCLYDPMYRQFIEFYRRIEPDRYQEAAADAARGKIEREHLRFPDYMSWLLGRQGR